MSLINNQTNVKFFWDNNNNERKVIIDNPNEPIYLESIHPNDIHDYVELWGNKKCMENYIDGQTFSEGLSRYLVNDWSSKFYDRDPFSAFSIRLRETNEFVGMINLAHDLGPYENDDVPGSSELAYIIKDKFWNRGYTSIAVQNIINIYAKTLVKEGYQLAGKPLSKISAFVNSDNQASVKILKKVGMKKISEEIRYGKIMELYSLNISDL